ncbi:Armadillo repeat-containing protein LFR [Capsicum annuum]|uniref:armadillo repeat-containing protein LFR n=1 Tax=Capsicum annuum TaxID=4072 RepID=UPI0007BEA853|nr:armadillo repeat-containing protein LFR [Capsicum annuum]KAF3677793.1 Armadillo repeat-containing protein LFR [Capsicum annuum]
MQKRQSGAGAGAGGGSATPAAKRGRPLGSVNTNSAAATAAAAAAANAADSVAPPSLLGPSLHVHYAFADQNNKRIVLALQSGLKSELTWALNTLTLLSFKEKDEVRKDATPLAKIPGLLDALLQVIDDWRDIALPRVLVKTPRVRLLGANSAVTGFGNEYEALNSDNPLPHPSTGSGSSNKETSVLKCANKLRPRAWSYEEDGLFNLDEEGRAEKQLCAVAASNILRNFSNMPDNEVIMAQHRHCLETIFQCLEDYVTEDEELVTNALETVVNLALLLELQIFSSPSKPSFIKMTEKRAVQALMGMLGSAVKAWHSGAAELIGRLIINPENDALLLPFASQIYKRLVDIISLPPTDAQAAAVGALYNLAGVSMDCRLKLASERWAIDRLLKVIKTPHPTQEVCRKAATILENLVLEPQNKPHLLPYENAFAEMLFGDSRYSDIFARILYELTSRPSNKVASACGIWGM